MRFSGPLMTFRNISAPLISFAPTESGSTLHNLTGTASFDFDRLQSHLQVHFAPLQGFPGPGSQPFIWICMFFPIWSSFCFAGNVRPPLTKIVKWASKACYAQLRRGREALPRSESKCCLIYQRITVVNISLGYISEFAIPLAYL